MAVFQQTARSAIRMACVKAKVEIEFARRSRCSGAVRRVRCGSQVSDQDIADFKSWEQVVHPRPRAYVCLTAFRSQALPAPLRLLQLRVLELAVPAQSSFQIHSLDSTNKKPATAGRGAGGGVEANRTRPRVSANQVDKVPSIGWEPILRCPSQSSSCLQLPHHQFTSEDLMQIGLVGFSTEANCRDPCCAQFLIRPW